jgi:hypothetical protein
MTEEVNPTSVNQLKSTARLLLVILLLAMVTACGITGKKYPEQMGRVLHETQDIPLPHTYIVALWQGKKAKGNSESTECYHVEQTRADDKGYFTVPQWREPNDYEDLEDKTIHIAAYRKRYRTSELTSEILTDKNYIYYLTKPRIADDDAQAREKRLRYLQSLVGRTTCDLQGESKVNLEPMYRAIVAEAEQIAVTDQDRQIVQKLKSWLSFVTPKEDAS